MKLQAPDEYWQLSKEERKKLLNQCGPSGPLVFFVPNNLLGLNISKSCNIHDYTFNNSKSNGDHKKSDQLFLKNLYFTIENQSKSKILQFLRKSLALVYFAAVRVYSGFKVMTTHEASEKKM